MNAAVHAPARLPLPQPKDVAQLLSTLLAPTTVKPCPAVPAAPMPLATFETNGAIAAVVTCSFELAAAMGAALCMMPAGVAAEAVKTKKLTETLFENWREVLNVSASLFNEPGALHARLVGAMQPPDRPAPEVAAILAKPAARLDLDATIKGFPPGKLSFFVRNL